MTTAPVAETKLEHGLREPRAQRPVGILGVPLGLRRQHGRCRHGSGRTSSCATQSENRSTGL